MGGFVLAWLTGMGIMSWRAVAKEHRPPWPGQLMAGSGYFILLGLLAQYPPARRAATLTAWGVDIAALLQVLPGGPKGTDAGGPWPPTLMISSTMIFPDGKTTGGSCTDASSASTSNTSVTGTSTATAPTSGSLTQMLDTVATQFGWNASQVSDWQKVLNAESGGNATAKNPSSGAFGAAQALGHGTSGTACPQTGENNYGGYGLTTAQAQAANCGNLGDQLLWMANYIKQTYGTPAAAWAHEQANNWY
jgi:hypothetical protein